MLQEPGLLYSILLKFPGVAAWYYRSDAFLIMRRIMKVTLNDYFCLSFMARPICPALRNADNPIKADGR